MQGSLGPKSYEEIFSKENSDAVLTSGFGYRLNPELNVLTGTLSLTLYPSSNKMKKMVNSEDPLQTPLFKFHVAATEALPQAGKDIQENASLWARDNGSHLKRALENIIHRVFIDLDKILKDPYHLPEE
jgi:hypothetical protein